MRPATITRLVGERSSVNPAGSEPSHAGPTIAKSPPWLPTVREPGAAGTLFHASISCMIQKRSPIAGTDSTSGSDETSSCASEYRVSTLKPTTVLFEASGKAR